MAVRQVYFTPALFDFLRKLTKNNNREWFLKNKPKYEADVRDRALRFIVDAGPGLRTISPHVVADPRPVGGSLFRVNRDVRFSNDKSPYKTAVGISFGHHAGRESAAPGYYLQLGGDDSWAGGGVHMPDTPTLNRVRDAIVADPAGWKRTVSAKKFAPMFVNMGEALKRPPRGYDPGHPHLEDLKRKSYTWHARFSEEDVCSPYFMTQYLDVCAVAGPFNAFLAKALDVPWL